MDLGETVGKILIFCNVSQQNIVRTVCPGLGVLRIKYLAAPSKHTTITAVGIGLQPQPDVRLPQQLKLVYQIIVFIKLPVLFPQPFHFLIHVLMNLIVTIWRLWLQTLSIFLILILQSYYLQPAYPIYTLPVLCVCFISSWWQCYYFVMHAPKYLFRC